MFGIKPRKPRTPPPAEIGGIRVRESRRARRLSLRVDARAGDVVLTWPANATEKSALRFIAENQEWIDTQRARLPAAQRFAAGEQVMIYGETFTIVHAKGRGVTRLDGANLIVHGQPEHLARRVRDFLKETARQVLEDKTAEKLEQIGKPPSDIRVIDPKTRWGSCGPDGRMMFSWRLILTPRHVLDYVVAHEVAHVVHLNHGRRFWALCAELAEDAVGGKRWLRRHGQEVMAYQ